MNRRYGTRRVILGALVVMLATVTTLGTGHNARASEPTGDWGSEAIFLLACESAGGIFFRDGLGNTECHYPNGDFEECDANGNDCWFIPVPFQPTLPGDHAAPGDIAGADPNPDGGTPPVPTGGPPPPAADSLSVTAADDDQDQDRDTGKKHKKHKKGKKGGKGRK